MAPDSLFVPASWRVLRAGRFAGGQSWAKRCARAADKIAN